MQSLCHDSSATKLTRSYPPSCSSTHHQVMSVQTNPSGSDTTFQRQLLPTFSRAPFSSTILPVGTSVPTSIPSQSPFSYLPKQDTNSDSIVTCTQYLPPASAKPLASVTYSYNARNDIGSRHSSSIHNKHSQTQLLNDHHQMNGNHSGGIGSLQQEFAHMVIR